MEHRPLGTDGPDVSAIGLGTWQLGADWGEVSQDEALAVLDAAVEGGVTFFDTADVYGDGRSESLIGSFLAGRPGLDVTVATKMGRRMEQVPDNYTLENFRAWTDRSRRNLGVDTLDLVQLHCPPSEVIESPATYDMLDTLVEDQVIDGYGVSVETVAQALTAIGFRHGGARPGVRSIQIILNPFRLKPLDEVLPAAREAGVGVIVRVPLASGLLSGRYDEATTFAPDDHRTYNRHGEAFDQGETFSGVDYPTGVAAAREWTALVAEHDVLLPDGTPASPAQVAIAWCAQQPGVTTVIPGARSVEQAAANALAGELDALPEPLLEGVRRIYDTHLRESVHPRW